MQIGTLAVSKLVALEIIGGILLIRFFVIVSLK